MIVWKVYIGFVEIKMCVCVGGGIRYWEVGENGDIGGVGENRELI